MKITIKSITTKDIVSYIAEFARVCTHRDQKKTSIKRDLELCKTLWKNGHHTPFESINIDFLIEDVSRSLLAQITRYRHASFNVESQRYVKYDDNIDVIIPESVEKSCALANGEFNVHSFFAYSQDMYIALLNDKIKPEDARCVLTNAMPTRFRVVMNLREFFHFYKQRSDPQAQQEIQELAAIMKQAILDKIDEYGHQLIDFIADSFKFNLKALIKNLDNVSTINDFKDIVNDFRQFV